MDKKEARKILGVTKETSRNDIERKFSILLKKQRAADGYSQEQYSFDEIMTAYNVLMGYEVPVREESPSKIAPLFDKAGIDEKKTRNFLHYYKYHILVTIAVALMLIFSIKGCIERPKPDFNIAFIGEIFYGEAELLKETIRDRIPEINEPGIDGAYISQNNDVEQQYAMEMKAVVLFAAGDIDVFIMDSDTHKRYAQQEAFLSLDEIAVQLNIDMEANKENIIEIREEEDPFEAYPDGEPGKGTSQEASGQEDDESEEPGEKHLYGIDVTKSKVLEESDVFGKKMVAAIYVNCKDLEKATKLLQLLLE